VQDAAKLAELPVDGMQAPLDVGESGACPGARSRIGHVLHAQPVSKKVTHARLSP
jgi:hypothetical protein